MLFEKTALIAVLILIGFAPMEKVLYQENFKSDRYTGSGEFTRTDGRLSLNTDILKYTGSGKWNDTITVQPLKIFCQWW